MRGRKRCIAFTALAAISAAPSAGAQLLDVTNRGAEAALTGWTGSGVGSIDYDSNAIARRYPDQQLRLFSVGQGGAIEQTIDVSGLAASIDAGGLPLSGGGRLGGWAGQSGAARLVVQPLDAGGAALGSPLIAGPPSDRDRQYQTKLLPCHANGTTPVGTRGVRLRLEASGQGGLADNLHVQTTWPPFLPLPYDPLLRLTDTPGCRTEERLPAPQPPSQDEPQPTTATPQPQPQPAPRINANALFAIQAPKKRCGSAKLRFSIKPAMRARVASFTVTARGKRLTRASDKTITIRAPRRHHTLHVRLKATLHNAMQYATTRRYRC